ncbi:MAG TPA: hypothetical protein DCG73_02985 [Morganella sp. (in: Bacteria)]|nr:hypothetical protein [Morganella sp. (in: enterobacteria)]
MLPVYESVTVSFNPELLLSAPWYQLVILVFFSSQRMQRAFFLFSVYYPDYSDYLCAEAVC